MELLELLKAHRTDGGYPMHMPGHKRNPALLSMGEPCLIDITEIDGFDNLHNAEGLLARAMERTAALWGAYATRYLVNGSTSGLLIALSALCPKGSEVIVARNCHLSVWHAIELRELSPVCVMPPIDPESGLLGSITPELLESAFAESPKASAVAVTSPTYEGVVSDIASLAKVAHSHGAWLIVDEAHGAHLGFSPDFPQSAVKCGADLVIQSTHKTLPALTQTALLHICNDALPIDSIDRFSKIYQTSSPSYLLMASIDACTALLASDGQALFDAYAGRLEAFYQKVRSMKRLKVIGNLEKLGNCPENRLNRVAFGSALPFFDYDPGKLFISTVDSGMTGRALYDLLRNDYCIQPEMATATGCLCMTSIADSDAGFERLADALLAIDAQLAECGLPIRSARALPELTLPERLCTPAQAIERSGAFCPFAEAEGQVSGEFVYAYPPDIPLLAPGERIDRALIECFRALAASDVRLQSDSGKLDLGRSEGGMLKILG